MHAILHRLAISALLSTTGISASEKLSKPELAPQTPIATTLAAELASAGYALKPVDVLATLPAIRVGDTALRLNSVIAAELSAAGYSVIARVPAPRQLKDENSTRWHLNQGSLTSAALRADLASAGYVPAVALEGVTVTMRSMADGANPLVAGRP